GPRAIRGAARVAAADGGAAGEGERAECDGQQHRPGERRERARPTRYADAGADARVEARARGSRTARLDVHGRPPTHFDPHEDRILSGKREKRTEKLRGAFL